MNSVGTLYQPGNTFLHRYHPLTKLIYCLCSAVLIFGMPGGYPTALVLGLLSLLLLGRAGLLQTAARLTLRLLGSLLIILILIHGFLNPSNRSILWTFGPLELGLEGLIFAAIIFMRLAAFLWTALTLVLSTHPARLLQALCEAGLPNNLAYVLGSPLLLLPQIASRAQVIRAAQQARGLETQGSLRQRLFALFPLVAPLVYATLVDAEERSLALEVRGFNAAVRKTFLHPLADTSSQRFLRRSMILATLILLTFGMWLRLNGTH